MFDRAHNFRKSLIFGLFVSHAAAQTETEIYDKWKQQCDLIYEKHQLTMDIDEFDKIARDYREDWRKDWKLGKNHMDDMHWSECRIDYDRANAFVLAKQYRRAWQALTDEMVRQKGVGTTLIRSSRNPGYFAHDVYCLHAAIVDQLPRPPKLPACAGYDVMMFTPKYSKHPIFVFGRSVDEWDDGQFPLPGQNPGELRERLSVITYVPDIGYALTSELELYAESAKFQKRLEVSAKGGQLIVQGVTRRIEYKVSRAPESYSHDHETLTWNISKFGHATLLTGEVKAPSKGKGSLKIVGAEVARSLLAVNYSEIDHVNADPWDVFITLWEGLPVDDRRPSERRWKLKFVNEVFAKGNFTLKAKNISLLELLAAFCEQCDLQGVVDDGMIRLTPIETIEEGRPK